MNIRELTISELETYYNLVQLLIDDTVRYGKMNLHSPTESYNVQAKLNKFNKYRDTIIFEIKNRLDEAFSE